jgi:molecular chaperone GrpE
MVNENNTDNMIQDDNEVTYDDTDTETTDTELGDDEVTAAQKLKVLRSKLQAATEESREIREELQRTKADFLNARKRLEEEVIRNRERDTIKHIEKILPLADSFYLATLDKEAWEKGDEKWRKGVEGIHNQLLGLLRNYGVESFNPTGEAFDPQKHEAMSTITVEDQSQHNQVLTVMQLGYTHTTNSATTVIRPARVTVGEYSETK